MAYMTQWQYLWRQTYFVEAERSAEYVTWISYRHVWRPDKATEVAFPHQDGLDMPCWAWRAGK